jgi:hypothetical protein
MVYASRIFCLQLSRGRGILTDGMFSISKQSNSLLKHSGLVFGIVTVVCLELGFTTFISTSDITERSSIIIGNADASVGPLPIRENNATLHPEDFIAIPAAEELTITQSLGRARTRKDPRQAMTSAKSGQTAAVKKKQTPTKLRPSEPAATYALKRPSIKGDQKRDATPVLAFQSYEATIAEASVKPRSEKRSLIASALPIVKKPYGWVKALGSKLF